MTVAGELVRLVRYRLDLVSVRDVKRGKEGTLRAEDYRFFNENGRGNHRLGTGFFFVHHRIVSEVKRVEFVSNRMSYVVLRGRWCNIIVPNAHAPSGDKSYDPKYSWYEEFPLIFTIFL
jgi:hypothetical protein